MSRHSLTLRPGQKQKKKLQDLEKQAITYTRSVTSDSSQLLQFDFSRPLSQPPLSLTDEQTARYASWTPLEITYPFANTITQRSTCNSPLREEAVLGSIPSTSPRAIGLQLAAPVNTESIVITSTSLRLAVLTNLQILGIPPTQYTLDSAVSPFCSRSSSNVSTSSSDAHASMLQQHAPDLTPTQLQREVPHHPYIDILPFRGLRDNLLVALDCGALDESELCADISRHLRVWGRLPQFAMSYEWAPEFVEKWAWVLDGEALSISNFWRAQRGDAPFEV